MIFAGGLIFAIFSVFVYCLIKKISFWKFADLIAPALALGYGIGRIGCFLTDFHPGLPTNLPWGFEFEGVIRQPIALYASIIGFTIWGGLLFFEKKFKNEGKLALLFLLLFAIYRFGMDFLRAYDLEYDPRYFGLTVTQYIALGILICVTYIIIRKDFKKRLSSI